ncbi:conserved hypothetical protein [Hymenobacter roseosalivarius DSM 11622]|uniref:Polyketide cyclase/dehydrase n=1 Tax=Hymenobacter roseosalivarius DSM 11622 TaxID=645990 RepID=A0A1W1W1P0_9BACT|nr:SRPBCC family protein [Hymenobacter roseosalivarius]SMB99486.1 conserved hypothetical protein [Hymenobacter roseosalivarius DSM 11622]
MKKLIQTTHTLQAPPHKVWAAISQATGVHDWLPVITACRVEDNQRICSTAQGEMHETILRVDHDHHLFQYAIDQQPLLPVENFVGTMQVRPHGEHTLLLWDGEFTLPDESQFPMVKQALEDLYAAGAQGLERISQ